MPPKGWKKNAQKPTEQATEKTATASTKKTKKPAQQVLGKQESTTRPQPQFATMTEAYELMAELEKVVTCAAQARAVMPSTSQPFVIEALDDLISETADHLQRIRSLLPFGERSQDALPDANVEAPAATQAIPAPTPRVAPPALAAPTPVYQATAPGVVG